MRKVNSAANSEPVYRVKENVMGISSVNLSSSIGKYFPPISTRKPQNKAKSATETASDAGVSEQESRSFLGRLTPKPATLFKLKVGLAGTAVAAAAYGIAVAWPKMACLVGVIVGSHLFVPILATLVGVAGLYVGFVGCVKISQAVQQSKIDCALAAAQPETEKKDSNTALPSASKPERQGIFGKSATLTDASAKEFERLKSNLSVIEIKKEAQEKLSNWHSDLEVCVIDYRLGAARWQHYFENGAVDGLAGASEEQKVKIFDGLRKQAVCVALVELAEAKLAWSKPNAATAVGALEHVALKHSSSQPTSVKQELVDKIAAALYPQPVDEIELLAGGYSGAGVYAVNSHKFKYVAKLVEQGADLGQSEKFRAEMDMASAMSAAGFAPKVVYVDAKAGILITERIDDKRGVLCDGGREPRLSATLVSMQQLHDSDATQKQQLVDIEPLTTEFQRDWEKVPDAYKSDPVVDLCREVMDVATSRLRGASYFPGFCHGDLKQDNVMFDGEKALFIDWATAHLADPMHELAYYAYDVEFSMPALDEWVLLYPGASVQEIARAKNYLAVMHAQRYLQTLRGMPWDDASNRDSKLAKHKVWLQQDKEGFYTTP